MIKILDKEYKDYQLHYPDYWGNDKNDFYICFNDHRFNKLRRSVRFKRCRFDPTPGSKIYDEGKYLNDFVLKGRFSLCDDLESADYIVNENWYDRIRMNIQAFADQKNLYFEQVYNSQAIRNNGRKLISLETPLIIVDKIAVNVFEASLNKPTYTYRDIVKATTSPEYDLTLQDALGILDLVRTNDLSNCNLAAALLIGTNFWKYRESCRFLIYYCCNVRLPKTILDMVLVNKISGNSIRREDWKILKVLDEKTNHQISAIYNFNFIKKDGTIIYEN